MAPMAVGNAATMSSTSIPVIGFDYTAAGMYDIWVGSAEEGSYSASIFYVQESAPDPPPTLSIDTSCLGRPGTALMVGERATVSNSDAAMYAVPETASTVIFRPPAGTILDLVAGPVCIDAQRWWRAQLRDGARGWLADGEGESVWLTPAG